MTDEEKKLKAIYDRAIAAKGSETTDLEIALLGELARVHPLGKGDAVWFRHLLGEGATLEAGVELARLVRADWPCHVSFNGGAKTQLARVHETTEIAATSALAVIAALSMSMLRRVQKGV